MKTTILFPNAMTLANHNSGRLLTSLKRIKVKNNCFYTYIFVFFKSLTLYVNFKEHVKIILEKNP